MNLPKRIGKLKKGDCGDPGCCLYYESANAVVYILSMRKPAVTFTGRCPGEFFNLLDKETQDALLVNPVVLRALDARLAY